MKQITIIYILIILLGISVFTLNFRVNQAEYMGMKNADNTLTLQKDLIWLEQFLVKSNIKEIK